MSSPQQKSEFSEKLMVNATGEIPASEKIPMIARPWVSDRAKKTLDIVSPTIARETAQNET